MALERTHKFVIKRRTASRGAESTVAHVAACAARDLRKFDRIELAELIAVKLAVGRQTQRDRHRG